MKLNGKQLAEHFGVTPGAVSQWKSAGMPCAKSKGRGIVYDTDRCAEWLREHGLGGQLRHDSKNTGELYERQPRPDEGLGAQRARKEAAEASLKEMELARRRGELIDRRGAELAWYKTARVLRDALIDTLPSKISPELAPIVDPWELETRLRAAIRAELHAIADFMQSEAANESGAA